MSLATLLLALLPLAAAPRDTSPPEITDRYAPGDELSWVFEQGGAPIGTHRFRYDGLVELPAGPVHRFRSWTRLSAPGMPVPTRLTGELWTDARGLPLRHVLLAAMGDTVSRVEAAFAGGAAQVEVVQGPVPRRLEVEAPEGTRHQANNMIGDFDLLFALTPIGRGESRSLHLFSSSVVRVFPYEVAWKEKASRAVHRDAAAVLTDSLGQTLTVDGDGHLLRIDVPAQQLVIRRAGEDDTVPPPFELDDPRQAAAAAPAGEDVVIAHGEVALAGTVTRPEGATGALAAVLFLSGSGPQDRQGFSGGIDLGTHELLDRLTADGFLVLRVDDRGVGASTGPTDGMALSDLVADAIACVDFLAARDDVDPARIALVGHSEGGVVAPLVAAERDIAALVLMASIGRPLPEVMLEQNARVLADTDMSEREQAEALDEIRNGFERLASDARLRAKDLPPEFAPLLDHRAWFQEHARHDPLGALARVRCPVLIVQGARDFQVSPDKDARPLDAALAEAGHPDHELVVFPDLDHLFKRVEGEESGLADYFSRRPLDAAFLDTVSAWLRERLIAER